MLHVRLTSGQNIHLEQLCFLPTGSIKLMKSHLKFGAGVADLIDVGQGAAVVLSP